MNGGQAPLSRMEHLVADIWSLMTKQDHPVRAAIAAKARNARKVEKLKKMRAKYQHVLPAADDSTSEEVK